MPTPRQRRKARNRDAILDVTAALIVRKGLENVSLREIARRADYTPAALYRYFEGKAAIFQALHARENRLLVEQLSAVPRDLPLEVRIVELCLIYIRFSLEHRAYLSLVNNLPSGRTSKADPVPAESPYAVYFQAIAAWVDQEAVPVTETYGLEEITYSLWAMIHGMATLLLTQLRDFEADFETANRQSLEAFLKGLKT